MPVASSHPRGPSSSERRASSSGSLSVSAGKHRTAASSRSKAAASSSSSSTPAQPILHTSSAPSVPVKSILLVNSDQTAVSGDKTLDHDDSNTTQHTQESAINSPSSFLKPLLKFLPRHIDPSTIARLLKNVHPSAFGAYRTKEAWRREHPEVLNTAQHIVRQEQAEAEGLLDIESSHAVLRPSVSSDEVCLAHSPPSATFSSSEDDDFDEEVEDEFERTEAKELDDYFNDEFDDDLGTSPESASSLRDLSSRRRDSLDSNASHKQSQPIRTRGSSQDSITTAKNDNPPSSSSSPSFLEELAALTISSPKSPLAIYLSKPDEEQDSPLAGPSQRVDHRSMSTSPDRSNDSSITVTSTLLDQRRHSPIASTSAAILYPDHAIDTSNRPRTPPSPSSGSLSPATSPSLAPFSSNTRRLSSSTSRSPSTTSQSRSQHYPTMPLPRIVKRQNSSSSLASSNCTCRSNTSHFSNASNASRSSSVTFAPLPEEEIKKARMESLSRNGGSIGSDKSKIMGIKGRRNLLLGLNGDEDNGSPSSPLTSRDMQSTDSRSTRDTSYRRPVLEESSDDEGEDEIGSPTSSSNGRSWGSPTKDRFDVIAYFGEEDLLVPPSPAGHSSVSLSRESTIKKKDIAKGGSTSRKASDVTIRYGKNGELVERRPLGVTLEELTLPMKRVKETRGRSRTTTDLSSFYTSPKAISSNLASPPISPPSSHSSRHPDTGSRSNAFTSPSRASSSFDKNAEDIRIISGQTEIASPESCNEKTPVPTPRLEKLSFVLTPSTSSTKPCTNASNASPPSSSSHTTFSPSIAKTSDIPQTSDTSPTDSLHSNGILSPGSNDITPMPTPRGGSPIAGFKMTASTPSQPHTLSDHSRKLKRHFELMDTASFTLRSPSPSKRSTGQAAENSQSPINESDDQDKVLLQISPVVNVLSLGGLLDDPDSLSNDIPSTLPPLSAKPVADPSSDTGGDEPSSESIVLKEGTISGQITVMEEDLAAFSSEEEEAESDFDEKTPTLQSALDLPKLNDTTHTLHSKYRKKRTVGIPHHVTARKKNSSSRKSKKA